MRSHKVPFILLVVAGILIPLSAQSQPAFEPYELDSSFSLPGSGGPFDVGPDGRIVTLSGADVYVESGVGTRTFLLLGALTDADLSSFGASFISVSPDGQRIAVGNNGGASFEDFEVGIFELGSLDGTWFSANHFMGRWIANHLVALTSGTFGQPSEVTALDTTSSDPAEPSNVTLIDNIGGASAGIAFGPFGHLLTGNGFTGSGPSETGSVRAFGLLEWPAPLFGASAVNFETSGHEVIDALSAAPLGFDHRGNLLVGGGDLFTGSDVNYAAVVRASAVVAASFGGPAVDVDDVTRVQKLDPDTSDPSNAYTVVANQVGKEIYLASGSTVWVFR